MTGTKYHYKQEWESYYNLDLSFCLSVCPFVRLLSTPAFVDRSQPMKFDSWAASAKEHKG